MRKLVTIRTANMFTNLGPGIAREIKTYVGVGHAFIVDKLDKFKEPLKNNLIAVWDTGATGTTITKKLAEDLALDEIGEVRTYGVTGSEISKKYVISLYLPNDIVIPELEVSSCIGDIGCDVLVGMDVITRGDFVINNERDTTFSFRIPSVECVDFTKHLPRSAIKGRFVKARQEKINQR